MYNGQSTSSTSCINQSTKAIWVITMDVRLTSDSWKDRIFVTRATKALTMTTSATTHGRAVTIKHASRPNVVPNLTNPLSTAQPATAIFTVRTASPYTAQKTSARPLYDAVTLATATLLLLWKMLYL